MNAYYTRSNKVGFYSRKFVTTIFSVKFQKRKLDSYFDFGATFHFTTVTKFNWENYQVKYNSAFDISFYPETCSLYLWWMLIQNNNEKTQFKTVHWYHGKDY